MPYREVSYSLSSLGPANTRSIFLTHHQPGFPIGLLVWGLPVSVIQNPKCLQCVPYMLSIKRWEKRYLKTLKHDVLWGSSFSYLPVRLPNACLAQALCNFMFWQDIQWKLHSSWTEGGAVSHWGWAALPHAAGEPLASALPGLHAA